MVREVLAAAGVSPASLDFVAVTGGPGSFTGLRVGLAFAKGFALALGIPCAGLGTLEALGEGSGPCTAAIDAGRGRVFMQTLPGGEPAMVPAFVAEGRIVGPGAHLLGGVSDIGWPRLAAIAALADPAKPARPVYLREADAIPKAAR